MFNQARRQGMAVRTLIEDLELGMRKKAVVGDDLSEITDEIEKRRRQGRRRGGGDKARRQRYPGTDYVQTGMKRD